MTAICGKPSVFSIIISEAPLTFLIALAISSAFLANTSKSSPNTFMATSERVPEINSLKRISIGCVNSISMFGIFFSIASFILSANSSLELAETHSDFGFNFTITSLSSILIGSVGTSAAPILLTTCSTSGKFLRMICSILVVVSIVLVNEVPVFKTG